MCGLSIVVVGTAVFLPLGELFGNSPVNIDKAMTNGDYGMTGQKLPLENF